MSKEELLERYAEWGFPQDDRVKLERTIRINSTLDVKKIAGSLKGKNIKLDKIPNLTSAYNYQALFPIATVFENLLGKIYIQESSAQIPAEVILNDIEKNNLDKKEIKILDMCAAPGGKTTQLSEVLENTGLIVAIDNKRERTKKLIFNLDRMKVTNCDVHTVDATELDDILIQYGEFDYVLLDAPCSGNYISERGWFEKREIYDFKNRQRLQKKLLRSAHDAVKEGGVILYSTCSLEKEENEAVVEFGTEELKLKVEPTEVKIGYKGLTRRTENCIRIWPTQNDMPGFFVAKLRK